MNADDRPIFAKAMFQLATSLRAAITDTQLDVYWAVLEDFPIADVQKGAARCVRYETRFPAPKILRDRTIEARREGKQLRLAPPDAMVEHRREAFPLLSAVLMHRLDLEDALREYRRLQERFPGVGWELVIEETKRRLKVKGVA